MVDAVMRYLGAPHRYDPLKGALATLITRIAERLVIDTLRTARSWLIADTAALRTATGGPAADDSDVAQEFRGVVSEAGLSAVDRLFLAAWFSGASVEALGAILGPTNQSRDLKRAKERLRLRLKRILQARRLSGRSLL